MLKFRELPYALETCNKWQDSVVNVAKYTHHIDLYESLQDYQPLSHMGDVVWIFGANCSGKTSLAKMFLPEVEPTFEYTDATNKKILISKYGDAYGLGTYVPTKKISGLDTLMQLENRYKAAQNSWLDPNCRTIVSEGILSQYIPTHVYYRMMQCIQPRNIYYVFLDTSLETLEERLFLRSQRKFADIKNDGGNIKEKYYQLSKYWMSARKFYDDESFDNIYNKSSMNLKSMRHFYHIDSASGTTQDIYEFIRSEMVK